MQQRGRKSAAQVEAQSALAIVQRPEAPLDLTPEETDVWCATVDAMPADWFPRETWPLLKQYCRHEVCARRVAQLIDAAMASDPLDTGALKDMLAMQARETASLKAMAAAMRLAQQSSRTDGSAATSKKRRAVARPWES